VEEFPNKAIVGKKIRARRRQLGLKLPDLANELFPLEYLREVENGLRQPSLEFLKYIANRLDLTISELEAETKLNARRSLKAEQELHLMNAHVAIQTNQPDKAQSYLDQVKPSRLRPALLASYYDLSGQVKIARRQYVEGRADLERALQLLESLPKVEPIQLERVRNWLGLSYYRQQDYSKAIEQHRMCLQSILQGKVDDLRFRMKIHYNLANEYHGMSDQEQALNFYYEAAKLAEEAEEFNDLAGIYWGIGLTLRHSNELKTATVYFTKSATLYDRLGQNSYAIAVKSLLGMVLIDREEYEHAQQVLKSALAVALDLNEANLLVQIHLNLAYLYFKLNNLVEAERHIQLGFDLSSGISDKVVLGQLLSQRGRNKLAQGVPEEAIKFFEQAEKVLEGSAAWEVLGKIYYRWYEALLAQDKKLEAFEMYQKSFECRENLKLLKR
jgi:tetratricopeptide (TPR) repeat protein